MSHNISIKLAPVLTAERWDDPKWMRPGRAFYWPGSLALIPRQPTPIVVDHDMNRVIGTVTELSAMEWADGRWIIARGVLDGDPPAWVRNHTPASVSFWDVHSTPHINGSTRVTRGIIEEISLLRDLTPAEPLAEVTLLRRAKEPRPTPTVIPRHPAPTSQPTGQVIYTPPGATLRRPGGRVLGVR